MKVCLIGNNLTSLILANILSQKKFYVEIYYMKSPKSEFKTRTENYKAKISSQNIKNRSKIKREEEPMDVEPLEKSSIINSQDMISNDKELIDIEDPW